VIVVKVEIHAADDNRRMSPVVLGRHHDGGLAPAVVAIVERGVARDPALAASLLLEIEVRVEEPYPPVRIVFVPGTVLVEDEPGEAPELRVEGRIGDLVSLLVAPVGFGGVPSLARAKGRAALGKVVFGHVRIEGRLSQLRRLLALLRL
jgi:hypothetical protein